MGFDRGFPGDRVHGKPWYANTLEKGFAGAGRGRAAVGRAYGVAREGAEKAYGAVRGAAEQGMSAAHAGLATAWANPYARYGAMGAAGVAGGYGAYKAGRKHPKTTAAVLGAGALGGGAYAANRYAPQVVRGIGTRAGRAVKLGREVTAGRIAALKNLLARMR